MPIVNILIKVLVHNNDIHALAKRNGCNCRIKMILVILHSSTTMFNVCRRLLIIHCSCQCYHNGLFEVLNCCFVLISARLESACI